jgi:hypothetical protein
VFELAPNEPPRQLIASDLGKVVTDLAATAQHVAWISESGSERLEVLALEIGPKFGR